MDQAAQGNVGLLALDVFLGNHAGEDGAGGDGVDQDSLADELPGHGLHQAQLRGFADHVAVGVAVRHLAPLGVDEDHPWRAAPAQVRQGGAGEVERGVHVDRQQALEVGVVGLGQALERVHHPGVVHEDVEAAEHFGDFRNGAFGPGAVGDVGHQGDGAAAGGFDRGGGGAGHVFVDVDDRHCRATGRQQAGMGAAGATAGSGDQGDAPFEALGGRRKGEHRLGRLGGQGPLGCSSHGVSPVLGGVRRSCAAR
ncbi:hypothetical protein D3C72_1444250 [compost metagenome]